MTIQEAHEILDFQLNKEIVGYVTPEQKDIAINRAQIAEFLDLAGDEQDFSPGAAVAQKGFGKSGWINDELRMFVKHADLTTDVSFQVDVPSDYFRGITLSYVNGKPIDVITPDRLAYRRESVIRQYNSSNLVAVYTGSVIEMRPLRAATVRLYYLRYPVDVSYVYTLSGRTVTYDAINSVDPEWSDKTMERIINRAISFIGDHLDAASKVQYAETKQQQGL